MAQVANGTTNGHGTNGGPVWLRFAYSFGVPALIAAGLVWFLASHVDGTQHNILTEIQAHRADFTEQRSETRRLLRAICINLSRDETQRAICDEPQR